MKCKRILSMLLTLCMVMSLFAGTTVTASAASAASAAEVSTWSDLQNAFTTGGEITLAGDVTSTDSTWKDVLTIPENVTVTLDLAGHKIDRNMTNATSDGQVIKVSGTLIINDSVGGGTITGGNCSSSQFLAGAVCVLSGGSFTLNGGSICGNKTSGSNCGTGVAVSNKATFIMNGGSICENVGTGSGSIGGGVGADSSSTVKLLGGRIEKNTVSGSSGGGLMFYSNKVTVGGSIVIKDNTAKQNTNNVKSSSRPLLLSEERPLTNKAEIGWTLNTWNSQPSETGTLVAKGKNAAQYVDNFFSDQDSSYIIGVKENESDAIYIATANSTVVAKPSARKVEITAGQHMTKTQDSGNASQTVTASAITDIVYTADTGHYFPENYVSTISNLTDGALNGITVTRNSDSTITVSGTPTADTTITLKDAAEISEPTFNDGFGNANITSGSYTVDNEYAVGSGKYVFAGWYASADYSGGAVTEFTNGTTYYAKWTKNDKTVRTTALDLSTTETNQSSSEEGWSWNAETKTLTLSGCTIDVPGGSDFAVSLPNGATLTTAANTQNTLSNVSTGSIEALWGEGAVTITGSGSLSLSGYEYGLSAGEITINAPITVIATNKQNGTAVAGSSITINSALSITEPSGGQIRENGGFHYIADRNGKFATNVVIGVAAPTFTDGLGNANCAFDTYTKGATNDKGYTFAGWFNGETELTSADAAVAGTTYTAKWTKNGKTVRTTSLDLTKIGEENTFGATLTDGVYTNADEGWSWNPETKTLTLSGVTMDMQLEDGSYIGVHLPADATVAAAENTENAVSVRTANPEGSMSRAIVGNGDLTISGQGSLTVVGEEIGIYAEKGNIAINAPITATSTGTSKGCGAIMAFGGDKKVEIKIDPSLSIVQPAEGRAMADDGVAWIAAGNNEEPVSNVVIGVAKKYTVTYNTNGGSAVAPVTVTENRKLTAPEAPTKDGYTFHGWYKDAAFTNAWNFGADTVTGNITLYAKWAETAKTYGISGTVYEYGGTTIASDVSVKLMKGDTQVASTTSGADGAYSFTGIAPGVYNIVAEKDDTTQTTLVIVTNHNETDKNVTLPQSKVNSKLTVNGADTPDVVAGGLDKEAAAVKAENSTATSVKVEMTVESKRSTEIGDEDKTSIETSASGKTLEYLDIKVTKTVNGTHDAITETKNMMEIIIPYDMTGKSNITVYRNHNGSAAAFRLLSTRPVSGAVDDGTYYLDTVNHLIYVYTQKFSTYAIGYNTQSGGGSGSGGSSSGGGSSSSSGGSSSGNSSTISTPSAKNGTVSVSPKSASKGTTVTVTVTPDKGYVLETLTVTDASGKKLDLKNLGSGKYSFTMPASKVEVKATFMEDNTMLNYFVDVPASAYYYDAVLWAAEQGITGGTDATHFSPDGVCTRAQAVTFLWRAAGSPAPSATAMPFTDVAADSYYYNAVLWAMENGITVGTSSTTFSPDLKCSRAHIMTFLWRSEKSPAAGSVNPFTDVSADAYYADAVLWAVKESVTNGTSSATFSPDADCTRAQIVTFIWRALTR